MDYLKLEKRLKQSNILILDVLLLEINGILIVDLDVVFLGGCLYETRTNIYSELQVFV